MTYKEKYQEWLNNEFFDEDTRSELKSIENDEEEIKDRFYQDLTFGTAGLRGKIGAGTNRMNIYNVAKASQGFADVINEYGQEAMKRGVAIAYDVRHMSREFSEIAAGVFAANGIKVYIHKECQPTPVLSYSVRNLHTIAGIMMTASHNPKEYNGYKAYWEEGSQILEKTADKILDRIGKINSFEDIKQISFEEGLESGKIEYISEALIDQYIKDVLDLAINDDIDKDIKIVYSPLNGTGNKLVRRILDVRGFKNVSVVKEQELPDPDFTTVSYPNPENEAAFEYSKKLGKEVEADILIATDPDADRLAVEAKDKNGDYVFLNGNKIGALLTNYILSSLNEKGILPKNGVVVKSIVTGNLAKVIAKKYGVEMIEVLTGFKNIYATANEYDKTHEKEFIFGFEESIGYSYGTNVRDKDAVSSAMMIAEMVGYYKKKGKSLLDILKDLFEEFGYYNESLKQITLEGADGKALIGRIMEDFRINPLEKIGDLTLKSKVDYLYDDTGYTKSNVLKYEFDDGSWYVVRPSGTEPKIKVYIYSVAENLIKSEEKLKLIENSVKEKMDSVE